ncbi:helix-turn-helix domain-containing protein [Neobacillus mesonae]|nr:helix-turn-helix domain-containing protein [Neobacillus mesonae]
MTEMKYFSIGEVAKLKGVTIKALRYYDKEGLLTPAYINPDNGYRYYSINQLTQIDIIKISRQGNFSIKELKELFNKADMNYLKQYLNQKKEEILIKIQRDKEICQVIDTITTAIDSSEEALSNAELNVEDYEDRYYLYIPTQDGELNEIKSYEQLDKEISNLELQNSFQYGLIYSNEFTDTWEVRKVFQLISGKEYSLCKHSSKVAKLPGGNYLTVIGSKENESKLFQSLLNYIEKNGSACTTIYKFYLMLDFFNQDS